MTQLDLHAIDYNVVISFYIVNNRVPFLCHSFIRFFNKTMRRNARGLLEKATNLIGLLKKEYHLE